MHVVLMFSFSLNRPSRMRTPVKEHLCKHPQVGFCLNMCSLPAKEKSIYPSPFSIFGGDWREGVYYTNLHGLVQNFFWDNT